MFQEKVLELVKRIPRGKVTTYKAIGDALHRKGQVYRAVGRALHDNKNGAWGWVGGKSCQRLRNIIPCHRVVSSSGDVGGYSRGVRKKIELLKKEGIKIKNKYVVDFEKKLFTFK